MPSFSTVAKGEDVAGRPLVIVHGYSDKGGSAGAWCRLLSARLTNEDIRDLHVADYVSLSNEITIKDIAEGFDRALRIQAGLTAGEEFDAIVHSTGMLVVRAWLTTYAARTRRLKHLIGLAPATFGSPMAHKGRSFLGGIFKGNRKAGPDFMEAGDRVLAGLELGSPFTWDLAHRDFLHETNPGFTDDDATPYAFNFIGLKDYGFLKRAVTEPGTDGTVRWSGAGFMCRKVTVDFTQDPSKPEGRDRVAIGKWACTHVPLVLLARHNHGSIFQQPTDDLVEAVVAALSVGSAGDYAKWRETYASRTAAVVADVKPARWQQWVTHLVDERGDPITDYYVELFHEVGGKAVEIEDFDLEAHAYRDDESYRCFHVDLDKLRPEKRSRLWLRLIATSGSALVAYHGYGSERMTPRGDMKDDEAVWDAMIDLSEHLVRAGATQTSDFFVPFTTTLVKMKMNREPMPFKLDEANKVLTLTKAGGQQ